MMPLIVDLDHTLIDTDLLYESSMGVLKSQPWLVCLYPFWFMRGKGYLKAQLVRRFDIDVANLPYHQTTLNYIKIRKAQGDKIILATASHEIYALAVAQHIQLFDGVMASDKHFNLSSHNKADKLVQRFGSHGFDYIGDHNRDIPVWTVSNLAILVNASKSLIKKTQHLNRLVL
ncbi:UbiA prenyltransferase family protein [hydrothermal vent metagenome]|uniref:UbiA prenyltransferase family protein n=2 Tax=hydrothermal vent metagenome TaxID=652676 RepID=A0A1W1DZ32_9ZZZZ